ncbi:hypothetical protein C8Q74DRAFT_1202082 [Fomes fomentarius]|nr:hypothetical protein C8Q74DRAFT_1202082 [Fomes fomentarius]
MHDAGPLSLECLPAEVLRGVCDLLIQSHKDAEDADNLGLNVGATGPRYYAGLTGVISLARTSRKLHEYAVDAIWNTLPGYGFLVYTLPQDAWFADVKPSQWTWESPETHLSVLRPLVDADFVRLKHYAYRIKRILIDDDCQQFPSGRIRRTVFDTSILEQFANHLGTRPLLRDLGVLHISPEKVHLPTFYRALPIFFGPRVRKICVHSHNPRKRANEALDDFDAMMQKLVQVAPGLLHFSFHSYPWYVRMANAISTAICRFDHLLSVHTDPVPISPEALLHLARLPALRIIDVKLNEKQDDQTLALFRDTQENFFSNLRIIRLVHQVAMPILTTVLRSVRSKYVTAIHIEVNNFDVPVLDIKDAISAIGSRKGRHRIKTLRLKAMTVQRSDTDPMLDGEVIQPLYKLCNLMDLNLEMRGPFEVSDDDLAAMARAWPDITTLELGCGSRYYTALEKYVATFSGLMTLARRCPKLETMRVPLDPDLERVPIFRPALGAEHSGAMQVLNVGQSKIEDPVGVASILSDIFPGLVEIEHDWPHEESAWEDEENEITGEERERILAEAVYTNRWQDVASTLLPKFVRVREQERNWARANGRKVAAASDIT